MIERMTPVGRRPELDPDRLEAAFGLVEGQVRSGRARHAALAVARSDGLVRNGGWGPDGPLTGPARFLTASITKPITATAVLQLVEDGRLALMEPLRTYLPDFEPEPWRPGAPGGEVITTWHLLNHTSGLGDLGADYLEEQRPSALDVYEWVRRSRLAFSPGSAHQYASDSWYLLSELVSRVGGRPLAEHMRERIFEPLGMTGTTFDPFEPGPPAVPLGGYFDRYGIMLEVATRYFVSLAMPGGGLWSTTEDLIRFGRAILGGGRLDGVRILGRTLVELMTRDHTADVLEAGDPPRRPYYGLGWVRYGQSRGLPVGPGAFGHAGATGGSLTIDPDNDLVVVYLRNEWGAPDAPMFEAVAATFAALE